MKGHNMKKTLGLYSGFDGEPEMIITYTCGDQTEEVRVWEGYFDRLMDMLRPQENGWVGIALHYHLDSGWYDEEWVDADVRDFQTKNRSI